jgi:hypothetical protein
VVVVEEEEEEEVLLLARVNVVVGRAEGERDL